MEVLSLKQEKSRNNPPEQISLFDNPSISKTKGFALARYSKDMTLLQRRILAVALSQILATDSVDQAYTVNVKELAGILDLNKQTLSRNITMAAKTMIENNQTIYFEKEDGWLSTVLIDSVERKDSYNFEIKFGSKLMPILLEMKKKYDIIYPLKSTLSFKSKYSHLLYDFLLAKAADIGNPPEGLYSVEISAKDLINVLGFKTKSPRSLMSQLNVTGLAPAIKDLNEYSDIRIEDNGPEILRDKTGIIGYIFRFKLKNSEISLVAAKEQMQLLNNIYSPGDLPPWDLLCKEMKKMGVSDSFVKRVEFEDKTLRAWKNILYTIIHGDSNPKYFNKAYNEDYASSYSVQDLLDELDRNKRKKEEQKKEKEEYEKRTVLLFPDNKEPITENLEEMQTDYFKEKLEKLRSKKK